MTIKLSALTLMAFTFLSVSAQANALSPLVCQNKKCMPASQAVTDQYLFTRLQQLFEKNTNYSLFLCEANPNTKMCLRNGITFPMQTGAYRTTVEIPSAKLLDVAQVGDDKNLNLILDYKVKVGNLYPSCQTAATSLNVFQTTTVEMQAPFFSCNLTKTTHTPLNLAYHIDYVDFDTGTIGAFYTANSGTAQGYMALRFSQPGPSAVTDPFPMPEVEQQLLAQAQLLQEEMLLAQEQLVPQEEVILTPESEQAHTQMDPIWMQPTPVLSLEDPLVVNQECANTPQGCPKTQEVASTTGLILQERKVIPSENGVKKTITITKRVLENGSPVATKEEVHTQNLPSNAIPESNSIQQQLVQQATSQETIAKPSEPVQVFDPHEIVLSENELIQVDNPQQADGSNPTQAPTKIGQGVESLWDKLEKYFYF